MDNNPEIELLNRIILDELKGEKDVKFKELIKKKAGNLYSLLSYLKEQNRDDEKIKKEIKLLIEEVE